MGVIKPKKKKVMKPKQYLDEMGDVLSKNGVGYILVHPEGGMVMNTNSRIDTLMIMDACEIIQIKHGMNNEEEAKKALWHGKSDENKEIPSYLG